MIIGKRGNTNDITSERIQTKQMGPADLLDLVNLPWTSIPLGVERGGGIEILLATCALNKKW